MALKVSPAFTEAGVDFDYLHLRTAVNTAPENDTSPFGVEASFRPYKKSGTEKLFSATDKVEILRVSVSDIEAKAAEWAMAGRLADAQLLADAMTKYEQALALFIEDKYKNLTVTVE